MIKYQCNQGELTQVFEDSGTSVLDAAFAKIDSQTTVEGVFNALRDIFKDAAPADAQADTPAASTTDYGLKKAGKATRTRLNEQCRNILATVTDPKNANLTVEQLDVLKQYSGKGGLAENSQYEYYTPQYIAEGVWDLMKANGYENGSVLDPCTGAGMFSATKPAGTMVTGCDLDPVASKVAQILNPTDNISTAPFEEMAASTEDNSFDCVIGNIPFGDARGEYKQKDPAFKNEKRIDRYFILRTLDKIRPGGLACFVCPTCIVGSKGKQWENFRRAVSDKAEFLGAHKLPSKTFAKQGTDTVTDVVIFKKHPAEFIERNEAKEFTPDIKVQANVYWDTFISGDWWKKDGKRFIHGQFIPKKAGDRFSRDEVVRDKGLTDEGLKRQLAVKFESRIDWKLLEATEGTVRTYTDGDIQFINNEQYEFHNGIWEKVTVMPEKELNLDKDVFGISTSAELDDLSTNPQRMLSLSFSQMQAICREYPNSIPIDLRKAFDWAETQEDSVQAQLYRGTVLGYMLNNMEQLSKQGADITEQRDRLQALITNEIETYGNANLSNKLKYVTTGVSYYSKFAASVKKDGSFSDFLAGKTVEDKPDQYDSTDPASIVSYLIRKYDGGAIELEDIKDLYTGEGKLETVEDLCQYDGIAIDPESEEITTMAEYCSGDIYTKMDTLNEAIAFGVSDERAKLYLKQIGYMKAIRPWTKIEDVQFSLQHKWIEPRFIEEFLKQQRYPIEFDSDKNVFVWAGHKKDSGFETQFVKYLNGGKITSSKKEHLTQYREMTADLERSFQAYMLGLAEVEPIEEQFNRAFNRYVTPKFSSTSLGIDNMLSGNITFHGYQNEEIRRLASTGCGICGFGTGLGKSFTALGLAAYNIKKGNFKRTCIVVPNAVLENWYHEAKTLYDEDFFRKKVKVIGLDVKTDKHGNVVQKDILDENGQPILNPDGTKRTQDTVIVDASPASIAEQLQAVVQNSAISILVMTKEKFSTIPIGEDTIEGYVNYMSEKALLGVKNSKALKKGSYASVKEDEGRRGSLSTTGKLKYELPTFEQLGIDNIIADECHFFKNSLEGGSLAQSTQYVSSAPVAEIAANMAMKAYAVRQMNGGKGFYGLSATPVTNSPLEVFNMMALVAGPECFKDGCIGTPDQFLQFFGDIQSDLVVGVDGEADSKQCLMGFKNLDGLRSVFHKYCNLKTVTDVAQEIHVPLQEDTKEEVENTKEQQEIYAKLRSVAKNVKNSRELRGKTFTVIRDMDRVNVDVDMFYHKVTYIFRRTYEDKLRKIVSDINSTTSRTKFFEDINITDKLNLHIYESMDDIGNAADITVERNKAYVKIDENLVDKFEGMLRKAGVVDKNNDLDADHPIPPKYAKMIANIEKHFAEDPKGKQIIFTEEKSQHKKIQTILYKHVNGIEPNSVAIINAEEASGTKLDKISKAYNSGEYKIIIANKKAEVGVNLQKMTRALHHLTLPWTPASIQQRNGRGVRQGNKQASVAVYYYLGKGSFDEYRQNNLVKKSNWIGQLLTGKAKTAENADALQGDDMDIMLAENPEEMKRLIEAKKQAAIEKKEKQRKYWLGMQANKYINVYNTLKPLLEAQKKDPESLSKAKTEKIAKLQEAMSRLQNELERSVNVPFDVQKLVADPSSAIVNPMTGEVLLVGDWVAFKYGDTYMRGLLIKNENDEVNVHMYYKDDEAMSQRYKIDMKNLPYFKKAEFSPQELKERDIFNIKKYFDISKYCSKNDFPHLSKKIVKLINDVAYIIDYDGKHEVTEWIREDTNLIYPEPENKEWLAQFHRVCLSRLDRGYGSGTYDLLEQLYPGKNHTELKEILATYAKYPSDAEIIKKAKEMVDDSWPRKYRIWSERYVKFGDQTPLTYEQYASQYMRSDLSVVSRNVELSFTQEGFNWSAKSEKVLSDYIEGEYNRIKQIAEQQTKEEEEKKRRLEEDPLIDSEWAGKLRNELNVTCIVNKTSFTNTFRGKSVDYEARGYYLLADSKFGGPLYQNKEDLKSKFKATFTKDVPGQQKGKAFWVISVKYSLEDIYNAISED